MTSTIRQQSEAEESTKAFVAAAVQGTARVLVGAAAKELRTRMRSDWTGIGMKWIRALLGKREWRVPCVDVLVRL